MTPRASVVVLHHEDQPNLDRVLAALEHQDLPATSFDVVVADDGSSCAPRLGDRPYAVRLVRQDDLGFRAAAARNLGAAGTRGDLVCYLDGDTVPEPGYLSALLEATGTAERALLVGRRRHADLAGLSAADVTSWLRGDPGAAAPRLFDDPGWLADAYARSDDLQLADDESYRHVISAVMAVTRPLLEAVLGFDERFTAYGGEDWELAHRCWLAGADFRHVPGAVAWHDGPDAAGRGGDVQRMRNDQALVLAQRLPSPALRPPGLVWEHPWCTAELDDRGWTPEQVVLVTASLLDGADVGIWLADGAAALPGAPLSQDPRVHVGPPPDAVTQRATWRVRVDRPVALTVPLAALLREGPGRTEGLDVQRTRDLARGRPSEVDLPRALVRHVGDHVDLEGLLRTRWESTATGRGGV